MDPMLTGKGMLSFTDAQHGWAAGGSCTLISTSDSGTLWNRLKLINEDAGMHDRNIRANVFG